MAKKVLVGIILSAMCVFGFSTNSYALYDYWVGVNTGVDDDRDDLGDFLNISSISGTSTSTTNAATATASADISQGSLRGFLSIPVSGVGGYVNTKFKDTIILSGLSNNVPVEFGLEIDGSLSRNNPFFFVGGAGLNVYTGGTRIFNNDSSGDSLFADSQFYSDGYFDGNFLPMSGQLFANGQDVAFDIEVGFFLIGITGPVDSTLVADYSNTAKLYFRVPENVLVQSASGNLPIEKILPPTNATVPEPATMALLGLALPSMAYLRRKRLF